VFDLLYFLNIGFMPSQHISRMIEDIIEILSVFSSPLSLQQQQPQVPRALRQPQQPPWLYRLKVIQQDRAARERSKANQIV
jgi:hypothetical protein